MKPFELATEIAGWIQIVLSPVLLGFLLSFIIYVNLKDPYNLIFGIILLILSLLGGILLANKKWKGKGTINFLSNVSATPDLDHFENDKLKKN
jgi:hypothetical protein